MEPVALTRGSKVPMFTATVKGAAGASPVELLYALLRIKRVGEDKVSGLSLNALPTTDPLLPFADKNISDVLRPISLPTRGLWKGIQ